MRPARSLPLAALLLGGCNSEFENPFEGVTRTVPPRASAAVIFTSNHQAGPLAGREVHAIDADGANLTRLTFCGSSGRPCDISAVSPAPDRLRVIVRRRLDANGNSRLDADDGDALVFVDLTRGTEAVLAEATTRVASIDWAPAGDVLVYSAAGEGGIEDLYRADPNGANTRNLTASATVRERGGRVDAQSSVAVYDRIDPGAKPAIFIFADRTRQARVTTPGPGTEALPGTPYVVGSDADGAFSPDASSVVFRRLTGTGAGGLGTWDIMTIRSDGTGLASIVSGPDYRGAPDWGANGIVFEEADGASGVRRLVAVRPDGSGRRVLFTAAAGTDLSSPRWLRAPQ